VAERAWANRRWPRGRATVEPVSWCCTGLVDKTSLSTSTKGCAARQKCRLPTPPAAPPCHRRLPPEPTPVGPPSSSAPCRHASAAPISSVATANHTFASSGSPFRDSRQCGYALIGYCRNGTRERSSSNAGLCQRRAAKPQHEPLSTTDLALREDQPLSTDLRLTRSGDDPAKRPGPHRDLTGAFLHLSLRPVPICRMSTCALRLRSAETAPLRYPAGTQQRYSTHTQMTLRLRWSKVGCGA